MGRRRVLNVLIAIALLTVVHWVDARTGSAPFQHLYYIPIMFAAITVPPYGGAAGAFACRFGGDEFVVSLPGSSAEAARDVATAIRERVSGTAPTLAGAPFPERTLSVSVGVAVLAHAASAGSVSAGGVDAGEALFRAADQALYAAKAAGRNHVSVAS